MLRPDGQNLVVWGPNGSGKSAVVDAIDFLLTGRISRLTGRGTAGISLARHGPHIDSAPSEAVVKAIVEVPGLPGPVEISRCIARPAVLECDTEVRQQLEPVLALAERGQNVLTRREILRYIATEAGTRAQDIQHLLNLTSVETTRKALVTVHHRCGQAVEQAQAALRDAHSRVSVIVGLPSFDPKLVLEHVNGQRRVLGGSDIDTLNHEGLQAGLTRPEALAATGAGKLPQVRPAVASLRALLGPQTRSRLIDADASVREVVATFRSEPLLLSAMRRRQLLELGESLIDATGACPLCEAEWAPGTLVAKLQGRLAEAETAAGWSAELSRRVEEIRAALATCVNALRLLVTALPELGLAELSPALTTWQADATRVQEILIDPVSRYPSEVAAGDGMASFFGPLNASELLDRIDAAPATLAPQVSPEQASWDRLT